MNRKKSERVRADDLNVKRSVRSLTKSAYRHRVHLSTCEFLNKNSARALVKPMVALAKNPLPSRAIAKTISEKSRIFSYTRTAPAVMSIPDR